MTTVLADNNRRAAHGKHRCSLCGKNIAAREQYRDCRIAGDGTVYTWREHFRCLEFLREVMDPWDFREGYDASTFHDYMTDSDFREAAIKHGLVGS